MWCAVWQWCCLLSCGVADGKSEDGGDDSCWDDVLDHDLCPFFAYKGIVPYFYGVVQVGIKNGPG